MALYYWEERDREQRAREYEREQEEREKEEREVGPRMTMRELEAWLAKQTPANVPAVAVRAPVAAAVNGWLKSQRVINGGKRRAA